MTTYQEALTNEDHMRMYFNDPAYADTEMRTNPYYSLIELTPQVLETFATAEKPEQALFKPVQAIPQSWRRIQANLDTLAPLMQIPNLLVAGGKVFSALFDTYTRDVDIFLWGLTQAEALAKVHEVISILVELHEGAIFTLTRTAHAISLRVDHVYYKSGDIFRKHVKTDYQIILRLYHSPSEVLHGFDVDSCCLGYDGERIWATERALFSLVHGYNTVNFDRLSPSYEYRLVKYATRGISVYVPDFDAAKLKENQCKRFRNLQGLDLLLQANLYWQNTNYAPEMVREVLKAVPKVSDYNPSGPQEMCLELIDEYMRDTANKYPQASKQYLPHLEQLSPKLCILSMPNPFKEKRIDYLKINRPLTISTENLQLLLNIDQHLYDALNVVAKWQISQTTHFKESNPGEQMTNTFHQTVLEDRSVWYNGKYYHQ